MGGKRFAARGCGAAARTATRIADGVRHTIVAGLQSVLDFLVEDCCLLCGAPVDPAADHPGDPRMTALLTPVQVRFPGGFNVVNHPVCTRCLDGFGLAEGPGTLARSSEAGGLETPSGGCFPWADEGRAKAEPQPEASVRVYSPFMTNDAVLKLVHRFKFARYAELGGLLGSAMVASLRTYGGVGDRVLVAMPMAAHDRRHRGFNAVHLLARPIEQAFGCTLASGALSKVRQTRRQSLTPHEQRADNVRGAFRGDAATVAGRRVLLLDDLVTSGATAASAAAELLGAGARSVDALCFARAL